MILSCALSRLGVQMNPPQTTAKSSAPWVVAIFTTQILLLLWAGDQNRQNLNTDAVAYLRIAGYYAQGNTELAVSGYWGPLVSWIIAVPLKMHVAQLVAARVVMGATAVLFSLASFRLLLGLGVGLRSALVGFALAAGASVPWSVEYISPDLLVSGLVCLAVGQVASSRWTENWKAAVVAGLLWGMAYLAKSVAFPLAFGMSCLLALLRCAHQPGRWRPIARQFLLTLGVFLCVASPWIGVLSAKYGHLTFSTTARIAHALAGPRDVERYHPFARTIQPPEKGRLTSWEDPSRMPYAYWSPFASKANFTHQLGLMARNVGVILSHLADFDLLHLGVIAAMASLLVRLRSLVGRVDTTAVTARDGVGEQAFGRWAWPALLLVCLAGVYLPVSVSPLDQRYFYAGYPLLYAAVVGLLTWLIARIPTKAARLRRLGCGLAWFSFTVPAVLGLGLAVQGLPDPGGRAAHALAERLILNHATGPVVGSGMVLGARAGLYTAFLLDQPWYGDALSPTVADYLGSGARLVILNRRQPINWELDRHPGFRSLDDLLFASSAEAERFPLKVYEILPGGVR